VVVIKEAGRIFSIFALRIQKSTLLTAKHPHPQKEPSLA
jgi:hypothetical protein